MQLDRPKTTEISETCDMWFFKSEPMKLLCQSLYQTRPILNKRVWLVWHRPGRVEICLNGGGSRPICQSDTTMFWFPGYKMSENSETFLKSPKLMSSPFSRKPKDVKFTITEDYVHFYTCSFLFSSFGPVCVCTHWKNKWAILKFAFLSNHHPKPKDIQFIIYDKEKHQIKAEIRKFLLFLLKKKK